MLPQLQSQTATIKINLKRKLQYKSSALSLNVRPYKVVEEANWLINNSSLYKDEGIVLDTSWINKYHDEIVQNQTHNQCFDLFIKISFVNHLQVYKSLGLTLYNIETDSMEDIIE